MSKTESSRRLRRIRVPPGPARSTWTTGRRMSRSARTELRGGVDGQLAEMYRDLAVQVKHMGQLQVQAGELCAAFRRLEGHGHQSPQAIRRSMDGSGPLARD